MPETVPPAPSSHSQATAPRASLPKSPSRPVAQSSALSTPPRQAHLRFCSCGQNETNMPEQAAKRRKEYSRGWSAAPPPVRDRKETQARNGRQKPSARPVAPSRSSSQFGTNVIRPGKSPLSAQPLSAYSPLFSGLFLCGLGGLCVRFRLWGCPLRSLRRLLCVLCVESAAVQKKQMRPPRPLCYPNPRFGGQTDRPQPVCPATTP